MNHLPWTKFYHGDWLSDDGIRACSLAARGLWIDMICLMLRAPERGWLRNPDGTPMDVPTLARRVGAAASEVGASLAELRTANVFSEDEGCVFCRRIVAETEGREAVKRRVAKHRNGVGNASVTPPVTASVTPPVTASVTPSARERPRGSEARSSEVQNSEAQNSEQTAAQSGVTAAKPAAPPVDRLWGDHRWGIRFDPDRREFVGITAEDRALWSSAYPAVNIEQSLARASAWCLSGPRGRKANYRKFLTNWLSGSQDRGQTHSPAEPVAEPARRSTAEMAEQARRNREALARVNGRHP